jgi:hypothetical protein
MKIAGVFEMNNNISSANVAGNKKGQLVLSSGFVIGVLFVMFVIFISYGKLGGKNMVSLLKHDILPLEAHKSRRITNLDIPAITAEYYKQ